MTTFSNVVQRGQWTMEQVHGTDFPSAAKCLEHQEEAFREEIRAVFERCGRVPQERDIRYVEYLVGILIGNRQSLGELIRLEEAQK